MTLHDCGYKFRLVELEQWHYPNQEIISPFMDNPSTHLWNVVHGVIHSPKTN